MALILAGKSEITARKEESLLIDLFKAFDKIKSTNRILFSPNKPIFSLCVRIMYGVPWAIHT